MNFSSPDHSEKAIQNLRDWWALAGVDQHYSDEPAAILGTQSAAPSKISKASQPVKASPPAIENAARPTSRQATTYEYPWNVEAFVEWLSVPDNLPESQWSNSFSLPYGPSDPQILVLAAMPDSDREEARNIFSKRNNVLLENMLRASGYEIEQAHFATIALARTPDGQLTVQMLQILKQRMLHYISLIKPERIIILGDTASKTFFGQDLLTARKNKQFINHVSSKTEAIATFHPRILLQRPEFKAEAWKDLQLILRTPAP